LPAVPGAEAAPALPAPIDAALDMATLATSIRANGEHTRDFILHLSGGSLILQAELPLSAG